MPTVGHGDTLAQPASVYLTPVCCALPPLTRAHLAPAACGPACLTPACRAPPQLTPSRLAPVVLALALLPGLASGAAPAPEQPSCLEVAVDVPLAPVFAALERGVPQEVRQEGGWERHGGFEVRYAARRAPLTLAMRGDTLFAETLVGYRVEARKRLLGRIPVTGSCGVDEPPRAVVLALASRVGIRPDWRLASATTVLPPRFLNPCRMTFAGIDVTGAVARALHERLWRLAVEEVDAAVPRMASLRPLAESAWRRLQEPRRIEDGLWLALDPQAVWATAPVADGDRLRLVVGVAARPRLSPAPPARADAAPLPALQVGPPRPAGLRLPLRVALPRGDAERLLAARLADERLTWAGQEVALEAVRLELEGEGVAVVARVTGALEGEVRVTGRPAYDGGTGEVYLADPDYRLAGADPVVARADAFLHDRLRGVLAARARWDLSGRIDRARGALEQTLNGPLAEGLVVETTLRALEPRGVRVAGDALVLEASLDALAQVRATRP